MFNNTNHEIIKYLIETIGLGISNSNNRFICVDPVHNPYKYLNRDDTYLIRAC